MRAPVLVATVLVAACQLPRREPVTPQRPTVSFDTHTTARGTVEVETGVSIDPGAALSLPTRMKLGATEVDEILVALSPYERVATPGDDASGVGDVLVGARHRLWEERDGWPAAALLVAAKIPTSNAASGRSSGETDVLFGASLQQQVAAINLNLFYRYGALGDPEGSDDAEHTTTLTGSVALAEGWGAFAELAGILVPSRDVESAFTITGVTWAPEPWLVLDGGVVVGFTDDAPDLQVFFGLTHNFGRVFGPR